MHSGHRERLRQKFIKEGSLNSFQPHNMLELLLFYAIPRRDTNEIAHRLINQFGSISAVFDASIEELEKVEGIGENSAVLIKLIPQISKAYHADKVDEKKTLDTYDKMIAYLYPYFIGETNEIFVLLCLDNKSYIKNCYVMTEGTLHSAQINKRKIIENVVACKASCVAIAHNHPNGIAVPSRSDVDATITISELLETVDVKLIDHFIFADDNTFSMASNERFAALF